MYKSLSSNEDFLLALIFGLAYIRKTVKHFHVVLSEYSKGKSSWSDKVGLYSHDLGHPLNAKIRGCETRNNVSEVGGKREYDQLPQYVFEMGLEYGE